MSTFGICSTRGVSFEPKAAIAAREQAKAELRKVREQEERAYGEHLPQQIKQMRREKRRNRQDEQLGIRLSGR